MKISLKLVEVKLVVTNDENTPLYTYYAENIAVTGNLTAIMTEIKRLVANAIEENT